MSYLVEKISLLLNITLTMNPKHRVKLCVG